MPQTDGNNLVKKRKDRQPGSQSLPQLPTSITFTKPVYASNPLSYLWSYTTATGSGINQAQHAQYSRVWQSFQPDKYSLYFKLLNLEREYKLESANVIQDWLMGEKSGPVYADWATTYLLLKDSFIPPPSDDAANHPTN